MDSVTLGDDWKPSREQEQELISESGLKGIATWLTSSLERCKPSPLNVSVTGYSGVGKSTFINAVLGLKPYQEGAAPVGVIETTKNATPYIHPKHDKLTLWDLPGVGTPNFPREEYLQLVEFDKYDFFLILSSDRFTENDLWLAKQIQNRKKKFYFLRTRIDEAVNNAKHDSPNANASDTILGIRQNCEENLQKAGFQNNTLFLISSREVENWDFNKALKTVLDNRPILQKEAFILSLISTTKELINKKRMILEEGTEKAGLLSTVGAITARICGYIK